VEDRRTSSLPSNGISLHQLGPAFTFRTDGKSCFLTWHSCMTNGQLCQYCYLAITYVAAGETRETNRASASKLLDIAMSAWPAAPQAVQHCQYPCLTECMSPYYSITHAFLHTKSSVDASTSTSAAPLICDICDAHVTMSSRRVSQRIITIQLSTMIFMI
jgi:hypothetical protein